MKGLFAGVVATTTFAVASAGDYCGQWDWAKSTNYIVYNNLWNKKAAASGSQCTGCWNTYRRPGQRQVGKRAEKQGDQVVVWERVGTRECW
ncbi:hypothetical protein PR003_g29126 [Phytophthora rubi]|uniref:Pectate lyase n=1 Tax=Phytophthora rubi TaxID=129364 RepID=A0A6A3GVL8_9STRA|nr:hypothetical protein PR001_g30471 [Phytophthora rubi]KAE8960888.1 hypothetical protein PR002_g30075 [Phytophthora rubi]KAE9276205.1 hypothetical protein PR003_g29126 [Phytophthora rubi]